MPLDSVERGRNLLSDRNSATDWSPDRIVVVSQRISPRRYASMATRVRPLQDRVIVKRLDEQEQKTAGGIIIPDTAKEKPQEGKVVAVGPGRREDGKVLAVDVKVGDRVLFGKYAGSEIKLGDEDHLILREEDILGVVEK